MIRIDDKYAIQADSNCYSVSRIMKNKNGKEYIQPLTYHSTLSEAFESIIRREQREMVESTDLSLNQAIKEFKRIQDELCEILKGISEKESVDND